MVMNTGKLIKMITGFCFYLAVLSGAACTLPATASRPPESESKIHRIASVPPREARYKLQIVSGLEGWLANGKTLWRTADGGKNWSLASPGEVSRDTLDSIKQVNFINSHTGWILANRIYKTEDSGDTWTRLSDPGPVLHSIHFLKDGKQGWAAGETYRPILPKDAGVRSQLVSSDGKQVLYPALFYTEDGGTTWNLQSLPSSEGRLLNLCFIDADHGWASSDGEFFFFEGSSNEWKRVNYSKSNCPNRMLLKTTGWDSHDGDAYAPEAIYFLDGYQGWLSFENGYLAKSTDSGRTWCDLLDSKSLYPLGGQNFLAKIHFITSMQGWGLGSNGSLLETDDGGARWQRVDTNVRFDDMCFTDSNSGWAVAKEGLFRISP
jgi:photosystem II stability/assembly factor-like uncharacterized protein